MTYFRTTFALTGRRDFVIFVHANMESPVQAMKTKKVKFFLLGFQPLSKNA
jgi:hypothetical protein